MAVDAYLALGGNIGDPIATLLRCIQALSKIDGVDVIAVSPLYVNDPVGGPDNQPNFVNCVCKIRTELSAHELLGKCLATEMQLGRVRKERWGPRVIDIDIVLYGNTIIDEPGLNVPHPRLRERLFMLVPLADVADPGMKLPPDDRLLSDVLDSALDLQNQSLLAWAANVVSI